MNNETDTTDEAKWKALKAEDRMLGDPFTGERLEPEEPDAFEGENIFSAHDEAEDREDDIFVPYTDPKSGMRGYLRRHAE